MRVNRNRMNILHAAAIGALYRAAEDDKGKGGAEEKKKADEPKKIELTEAELQAKIEAATAAAVKARDEAAASKQADEKAKAEEEEAKKRGEFETLAQKADEKRTKAEAERDAANRRAQIAEVNIQLRDHLATTHADYLSNAADIMLHVEKKLAADAKPEDVAKLIKDEAAAFVERTPRGKAVAGTPSGIVRGKAPGDQRQQQQAEHKQNNHEAIPRRSFAAGF